VPRRRRPGRGGEGILFRPIRGAGFRATLAIERGPNAPELIRQRVNLAGVLIDRVGLAVAAERLERFLTTDRPHQVVTVNLDHLSIAQRDAAFHATLNQADLAVADGMPLLWLARLNGQPIPARVTGFDLVAAACRLVQRSGGGVFLLGSTSTVLAAAGARLRQRFPKLRVQTYAPPFGPLSAAENVRILAAVRGARPDCLFVALGAPRQELWIREQLANLEVPVVIGVGCVLDHLAGQVKRAPGWMQRLGLEWGFRLGQEPRRLWRRYLVDDLPLLARLLIGTRPGRGSGPPPAPSAENWPA
jgi:N-acetylglucosaminyldiphosphoundecaprenol N-acetyl-beta-D-mannosaminyltransferase